MSRDGKHVAVAEGATVIFAVSGTDDRGAQISLEKVERVWDSINRRLADGYWAAEYHGKGDWREISRKRRNAASVSSLPPATPAWAASAGSPRCST